METIISLLFCRKCAFFIRPTSVGQNKESMHVGYFDPDNSTINLLELQIALLLL